jgi:restriction system protein
LVEERGNKMSNHRYFMVRAGWQSDEDFNIFFKKDKEVVAVGWSEVDFAASSQVESLVEQVDRAYYADGKVAPRVVGKKKNEVRRFKELKKDNRILIPHWGEVLIAIATGEERYSSRDKQRDLANQHIVKFKRLPNEELLAFPRDVLSEGLQRRLRVRGTAIADLGEFASEVEKLFDGEAYAQAIYRAEGEQRTEFERHLVQLLQDGTNTLQSGGVGLEDLVAELLEIDGYVAKVQSKRRFAALSDADIEATRNDYINPVKLLVQVKHHSGLTDVWGAQQLANILKTEADLFSEHQLVLVTTAKASNELRRSCEDSDIILITGQELAEWIASDWRDLHPETRRALRLGDVPQIVKVA